MLTIDGVVQSVLLLFRQKTRRERERERVRVSLCIDSYSHVLWGLEASASTTVPRNHRSGAITHSVLWPPRAQIAGNVIQIIGLWCRADLYLSLRYIRLEIGETRLRSLFKITSLFYRRRVDEDKMNGCKLVIMLSYFPPIMYWIFDQFQSTGLHNSTIVRLYNIFWTRVRLINFWFLASI